jgi:hypothetical protein
LPLRDPDARERRRLGPSSALPALLLSTPMYSGSAPAGLFSGDGVVAILFLYLVSLRRPLLAGVVLGCLPGAPAAAALAVFARTACFGKDGCLLGCSCSRRSIFWQVLPHEQLLWPLAYRPQRPARCRKPGVRR